MIRHLPPELELAWSEAAAAWEASGGTRRLWGRDASLWTGGDEDRWLGWLEGPERERARLDRYVALAAAAEAAGVRDVLLLGMGGSSLGAEVLRRSFGAREAAPALHVLDSTHPDQVETIGGALDPATTWVLVASKSGSTLEPSLLMAWALDRFERALGGKAASRFVAITDPGSRLEEEAKEHGFRDLLTGEPTIGGRFSALSPFGLAPAALIGVELGSYLERAAGMAGSCRRAIADGNPGVELGLALGVAALAGRDKLTLVLAPEIAALGSWLEQLIAESTGKQGRAILPVDGEPLGAPASYGPDRLFVAVTLAGRLAPAARTALDALARSGQPVLEIDCPALPALGAEFFRWEIATAVASALLAVNPFDQPDVESAKVEARRVAAAIEASGIVPLATPFYEEGGVELHADEANRREIVARARERSLAGLLAAHLERAEAGDYFALLAFVEMCAGSERTLSQIRARVAVRTGIATTVGFGPRFLHSTGQAHKGGPPSGLFLQLTDRPRRDLAVPGQRLSFGQVVAAQALGDLAVLQQRGRRALRVHLGEGAGPGLEALLGVLGG